jgi:hypothetical protein
MATLQLEESLKRSKIESFFRSYRNGQERLPILSPFPFLAITVRTEINRKEARNGPKTEKNNPS